MTHDQKDTAMTSTAIPSPKPCPFCGGNASRQDLTDDDNAGGSCITCDSCGASSPVHFDRKENLYDSWNRRSPSSSEDVRREALEEAAKVADQLAGELVRLKGSGDRRVQIGSHLETCATIAASIRALSQKE